VIVQENEGDFNGQAGEKKNASRAPAPELQADFAARDGLGVQSRG
jgi:hypothetical protein